MTKPFFSDQIGSYKPEDLGIDQDQFRFVSTKMYRRRNKWWKPVLFGIFCVAAAWALIGAIAIIVVLVDDYNYFKSAEVFGLLVGLLATLAASVLLLVLPLRILLIKPKARYNSFDFVQHHKLVHSRYLFFLKNKKWGVCDSRRGYKIIVPATYDKIEIGGPEKLVVTREGQERTLFIPGARFGGKYYME